MSVAPPRTVTPFEGRLIAITRAIVRQTPVETALPLIADRQPAPAGLTRAAVELVSESLVNGCIMFLARSGGWRRERFLRDGKPNEGRLWQRTSPEQMPLRFSRRALDWLVWLTSARPDEEALGLDRGNWTVADRLLVFLTFDALRDSDFVAGLRQKPIVAGDGLIRLAFPEEFVSATIEADFEPWFDGLGPIVLEAMTPWLADRWSDAERRKNQIGDWPALAAFGREQERTLAAFTDAAEEQGRLDLNRFILLAANNVLAEHATIETFTGGLQGAGPTRLADRIEVMRKSLAIPRHLLRLRVIEQKARTIGYLDDGYAAAQFWLSEWERLNGDALAGRAQSFVDSVEPLSVSNQPVGTGEPS